MNITAVQLQTAFAEWVREFQRDGVERNGSAVINFATVDAEAWARESTPYFWTLLKRAAPPDCLCPCRNPGSWADEEARRKVAAKCKCPCHASEHR